MPPRPLVFSGETPWLSFLTRQPDQDRTSRPTEAGKFLREKPWPTNTSRLCKDFSKNSGENCCEMGRKIATVFWDGKKNTAKGQNSNRYLDQFEAFTLTAALFKLLTNKAIKRRFIPAPLRVTETFATIIENWLYQLMQDFIHQQLCCWLFMVNGKDTKTNDQEVLHLPPPQQWVNLNPRNSRARWSSVHKTASKGAFTSF